jgi:tetrahydromethanopterin S-methyltransferase subunit B
MADETTSLVLEHLRPIRTQIAGLEEKVDRGFSGLSQRLDAIETEVRRVNYAATVSIGSILVDIKDLKERVARLENA